ncbi:MAG: hypothetical protein QXK24_01280 [Ignisphaera sp.]
MGLLGKLFGKPKKKAKKVYMIIEGEHKEYIYVDGKLIPKDRIVQIDLATNKVVYVDLDGKLKVAELEQTPIPKPIEKSKLTPMFV